MVWPGIPGILRLLFRSILYSITGGEEAKCEVGSVPTFRMTQEDAEIKFEYQAEAALCPGLQC